MARRARVCHFLGNFDKIVSVIRQKTFLTRVDLLMSPFSRDQISEYRGLRTLSNPTVPAGSRKRPLSVTYKKMTSDLVADLCSYRTCKKKSWQAKDKHMK